MRVAKKDATRTNVARKGIKAKTVEGRDAG
jgi:hypothetical protein